MKFISRKAHAVLDYVVGVTFVAAPWLLGFAGTEMAKWAVITVGLVILLVSMITNYEGGISKILPMDIHLILDVILGIFLTLSPWLLGFSNRVHLPHLVMGLFAIGVVICTKRKSERSFENGTTRPGFWYR